MSLQTYKETCEDISFDCNTDVITATCYNKQGAGGYRTSSLSQASTCPGDITTSYGRLSCILTATPSPSFATRHYAAAPASCPYYKFVSKLDGSGIEAPEGVSKCLLLFQYTLYSCTALCIHEPIVHFIHSCLGLCMPYPGTQVGLPGDVSCHANSLSYMQVHFIQRYLKCMLILLLLALQSYKETCSVIKYNCSTDTVTARCVGSTGRSVMTSLADASECHDSITGHAGSIANINGELECQSGTQA